MKRGLKALAVSVALAAVVPFSAFAASDNHSTPGTPGTKNCVGQTTAYLAQGNETGVNGIGNVVDVVGGGVSVQYIKAYIDEYCA